MTSWAPPERRHPDTIATGACGAGRWHQGSCKPVGQLERTRWTSVRQAIFAIACVVGGYVAGRVPAGYFVRDVRPHSAMGDGHRIVTACLIFVPLAFAEYAYYGPMLIRLFPVVGLGERSVVGLP
jgi:hypothetical protein